FFDKTTLEIHRGQFVLRRKSNNQFAMNETSCGHGHNQAAIGGTRKICDRSLNLTGVANIHWSYFYPQRRCYALNCTQLPSSEPRGRITKDGCSLHAGSNFLEQF